PDAAFGLIRATHCVARVSEAHPGHTFRTATTPGKPGTAGAHPGCGLWPYPGYPAASCVARVSTRDTRSGLRRRTETGRRRDPPRMRPSALSGVRGAGRVCGAT